MAQRGKNEDGKVCHSSNDSSRINNQNQIDFKKLKKVFKLSWDPQKFFPDKPNLSSSREKWNLNRRRNAPAGLCYNDEYNRDLLLDRNSFYAIVLLFYLTHPVMPMFYAMIRHERKLYFMAISFSHVSGISILFMPFSLINCWTKAIFLVFSISIPWVMIKHSLMTEEKSFIFNIFDMNNNLSHSFLFKCNICFL